MYPTLFINYMMKRLSESLKEIEIAFSFPIRIVNDAGKITYRENKDGFWCKRHYDSNGNRIYYENSLGSWRVQEFNSHGERTYFENSHGDKHGTPRSAKTKNKNTI